jgi:CheY-like chemotaxis protein
VRQQPDAIDLVVTDFNMSSMSGLELAAALASVRPDLPVVLISGALTDEVRAGAARLGVCVHCCKRNLLSRNWSKLCRTPCGCPPRAAESPHPTGAQFA